MKDLRSDNGGEYVSNDFKDFCVKEGNIMELTTPHNPQRNGVAEKKNHSIVDVERGKILELIHIDVCGPMKTRYIGGAWYFIIFVDDRSRYTWVYFIRNKSGVF